MPKARAAVAARALRHPTTPWPVRAGTRLATGVTEPDGHFWLAPLANGARRHYSLARFVHDPELVCNQRFDCTALRKHAAVGLEPPSNVVASLICPRSPLRRLVKAGPSEGTHNVTHPTSPRSLAVGPLTSVLYEPSAISLLCCAGQRITSRQDQQPQADG